MDNFIAKKHYLHATDLIVQAGNEKKKTTELSILFFFFLCNIFYTLIKHKAYCITRYM